MPKYTIFFLLLLCQIATSQTVIEKTLHGKIVAEAGFVGGVTIINLVNEKSSISDNNGEFYISAKPGDLLVFTAINMEYHRRQIEEKDLKTDILIVKMTAKVTELKEVIINKYPAINAVALGISPRGIKKYTPAERRFATASSMQMNPMGLDPLLNLISGRTAMLKKEIEVEKKERLLVTFSSLFDSNYFQNRVKIPADYCKGFQYYCIEQKGFAEILKTKNKTKIEFAIVPLAEKYNKFIAEIE